MSGLRVLRRGFSGPGNGEAGQVLPLILILMTLGSLLVVPSLDLITGSRK
jgi:hypothetical protein